MKMQRSLILVLILLCPAVSQFAYADDNAEFLKGKQAYNDDEYAQAFAILKPLGESGNSSAQYYVARMYEKGRGVPKDHAKMLEWYRRSADAGNAKAQYKMAVGYAAGYAGLEKNDVEAGKWLLKSAEQGYRRAMKALGKAYKRGQFGLPKDQEKAKFWLDKAGK
jgi:TPR repeat protein